MTPTERQAIIDQINQMNREHGLEAAKHASNRAMTAADLPKPDLETILSSFRAPTPKPAAAAEKFHNEPADHPYENHPGYGIF